MKPRPLAVIFFTVFLDLLGFGLVLPLLPGFAKTYGASELAVGLLMATYSLFQFVFAPIWGALSDRVGRRPVLLLSIAGSTASYVIFAFAPSLPWLFVSRALAGVMAANLATAQAYVADVTAPEDRAKGMGMVGAAFGLGFVFGPTLGIFAGPHGQLVVGLVAASLSGLDLLLAAVILRESLPADRRGASLARGPRVARMVAALRDPLIGPTIGIFFLATLVWSTLQPTLPLLLGAAPFEFGARQISGVFAYMGLLVAFMQGGLAGRMARQGGEGRMALMGLLFVLAGMLLLPGARSGGGLYAVLGLIAVGQGMCLPALQSMISRAAAADEQGGTLGVGQGFSSLARVIGPATAGALYGVGRALPFWTAAVLELIALAIAVRVAMAHIRRAASQRAASKE